MTAKKVPATEEPQTRDYPVRAHFRKKDPKTGKSVIYDPNGDDLDNGGWPGAKAVFAGVPGSPEVEELFAGADGIHGPLLFPIPDEEPSSTTPSKES